ncbi:hypothetical protein CABS01_17176 [Colletotrichum abscissum]|uniref:uncharacterized protein n=1 Tax=Colletotrichum abscissum TaxID=1671311 RepID=UPI0027D676CB|nr:uncharacterized protein CABS01_17176 [Colletotrichum abscissum]KAK1487067.1 hypothetical protein CABS01_17176 [Colletotrichum abscissum]
MTRGKAGPAAARSGPPANSTPLCPQASGPAPCLQQRCQVPPNQVHWRIILRDYGELSISIACCTVREPREGSSGAKGKTGTRAFKAIGALLGEQHSFMHDLESFFWVLFWICIHYDADGKDVGLTGFDRWNYESDDTLAEVKMGVVADEQYFQQKITESFTAQYQPLVPWDTKL